MLTEQNRLLDGLADLMKSGAGGADSGPVQKRLEDMAGFF